jgi:hypothetical protein
MCAKHPNKSKTRRNHRVKPKAEATRILRTLNGQEAFYFYEAVGKPIGENAASLSDFVEKMKSVKMESILFHLQRKDFQNWIKITLGDSKLAKSIARIPVSHDESVRTRICSIVENRVKELGPTLPTVLVVENLTLASPICES